jgi:hypothetical protein
MELLNGTRMKAAYTMGVKPSGQESLVVVVKGTFLIPANPGAVPELAAVQLDPVMADEFTGEPGFSAPRFESDFAAFKPRCDVLLDGIAHAPAGKPLPRVQVGLRVGSLMKSFEVVGDRFWKKDFLGVAATHPLPFTRMPISYDRAFGGSDRSHADPRRHAALTSNPVGRGFHVNPEAVDGKPLPNTEEAGRPVTSPEGDYRPMSFGPVGRGWQPRLRHAGTYDQNWIDHVFPFLPADFDERHYQSAPDDQQIEYPRGGEEVVLMNLTPAGRAAFVLPAVGLPVTFYRRNGEESTGPAVVDTISIEPEAGRFSLVWRASLPLKKNMLEVAQVVVGRMSAGWHRARNGGKRWYPSLAALVREQSAGRSMEG